MKKLILAVSILLGCAPASYALSFGELKDQIVDQTKVTIFTEGGVASFYDFSVGRSNAVRAGAISHVLTNRFIQADLGWAGGFDGHTDGILTGGPSVRLDRMFTTFLPDTSSTLKYLIPSVLQKLYVGAGIGWSTDDGAPHSMAFLGYDF